MNRPLTVGQSVLLGALAVVLLILGITIDGDFSTPLIAGASVMLLFLLLARVFGGGDWSTMSRSRSTIIGAVAFAIVAVVGNAARSDEPVREGLATLVACVVGTGLVLAVLRGRDRRGGRRG